MKVDRHRLAYETLALLAMPRHHVALWSWPGNWMFFGAYGGFGNLGTGFCGCRSLLGRLAGQTTREHRESLCHRGYGLVASRDPRWREAARSPLPGASSRVICRQ